MNPEQREYAMACAAAVARKLPNGATSGDFRRASRGENEDLLMGIHLVLEHYENGIAQARAID